ncbi:MAG: methyl-accepting chemotaxis protein [Desulfatitalea sp.]
MQWYNRLTISRKLTLGFTVMLLFIAAIGWTCYTGVHKTNGYLQEIFSVRLPGIDYLLETDRDLQQLLVAERSMIFADTNSEIFKQLLNEYETNLKQSQERWEKLEALPATDDRRAIMKQYNTARAAWLEVSQQIAAGRKADTREGRRLALDLTLGLAKERFEKMRDALDQLTGMDLAAAQTASKEAEALYGRTMLWLVAMVAGALVAGLLLSLFIGASITRPLNAAVAGLKDIAEGEGDLTKRLEVKSQDELGELSQWFNVFLEKLQEMVRRITSNAETLSRSAETLTTISEDMTQGADAMTGSSNSVATAAEEMSTNINSVAAAMELASTNMSSVSSATEEMGSTIAEIAVHTEKARTITNDAVTQTKETSTKMDQLGEAARSISKVTEVITEISEQTNLLALNATIEAARAGEAGKGFAVVANEIKALARQTAAATQEIKGKIAGIQGSTEQTISQISQISRVINDINEIVSTISSATEEQSTATKDIAANVAQASSGISEVNQNVAQSSAVSKDIAQDIAGINHGVGDMSNRCSQVNASALELKQLADQLNQLMGGFKV